MFVLKIIAVSMVLIFIGTADSVAQKKKEAPLSKEIRKGILSNGLTYYICKTDNREKQASFYLIQNTGAILEDDDQNGLAHFLEHMCVKGTRHFPGRSIFNMLERRGLRKNINAYTGHDETVYCLYNIPLLDKQLIDTSLLILHDWCNELSLPQEAIDLERLVIIEEWRSVRNAQFRISSKIDDVLYNNSKYSKRDKIGDVNIIKNFDRKTLKKFYDDWYRTDLQCIAVVGDVNVKETEAKIKKLFSKIPALNNAKKRENYKIPNNDSTLYILATDPETKQNSISINMRHEIPPFKSIEETYKSAILNSLLTTITNKRYVALPMSKSIAFKHVFIGCQNLLRDYYNYGIYMIPKQGRSKEALTQTLEIYKDILKDGFSASELSSAKKHYDALLESNNKSKNKISNNSYFEKIKKHFLKNFPLISEKTRYKISKDILEGISLEDIECLLKQLLSTVNKSIVVIGNDVDTTKYLSKREISDIIENTRARKYALANKSNTSTNNITSEKVFPPINITGKLEKSDIKSSKKGLPYKSEEWILENGAKVIYKKCTTSPGVVSLFAQSPGGLSVLSDEQIGHATVFNTLAAIFSIDGYSSPQLRKVLNSKGITYKQYLTSDKENFTGECKNEKYIEELFKILYMSFEHPSFDENSFTKAISEIKNMLKNKNKSYVDELRDSVTLISNSYKRKVITNVELINSMRLNKIVEIYMDRYSDASNFTFYIVGDISKKKALELSKSYIGTISSTYKKELSSKDGYFFPKGLTNKIFKFEMVTPKAGNIVIYDKQHTVTEKDKISFNFIKYLLNQKLVRILRENESGTYYVNVNNNVCSSIMKSISFNITYQCAPNSVERLNAILSESIKEIVSKGFAEDEIINIKRLANKPNIDNPTNLYYLNKIVKYNQTGVDNSKKGSYKEMLSGITSEYVNSLMKDYFNNANILNVIYMPR